MHKESHPDEFAVRDAVLQKHIVPWFQPIVDCNTGRLRGIEALARWDTVPPLQFMPMITRMRLEGDPLASLLGHMQASRVSESMPHGTHLSINVSARALLDSKLPEKLIGALGIRNPGSVMIEITESDIVDEHEFDEFVTRVAIFSAHGFRISVDDFGQGYASLVRLAYLREQSSAGKKLDIAQVVGAGHEIALTEVLLNIREN